MATGKWCSLTKTAAATEVAVGGWRTMNGSGGRASIVPDCPLAQALDGDDDDDEEHDGHGERDD